MRATVPEFPIRLAEAERQDRRPAPSFRDLVPAPFGARIGAYLIDLVAIGFLSALFIAALFVLGFLSFGASWLLIWPSWIAAPIVYSGLTLSSRRQATFGMRLFGLAMRPVDGGEIDFLTGAAHALLFYVFVTAMTPLTLLIGIFTDDHALLHDIVLRVRLMRLASD
jgi:uncharacterized RDD family membrane protein YckC